MSSPSHRGSTHTVQVPVAAGRSASSDKTTKRGVTRKKPRVITSHRVATPAAGLSPSPVGAASKSGLGSPFSQQRSSSYSTFLTRVAQNLVLSCGLILVSFYLSVYLEETARQLANTPHSVVPPRARAIINLVGTGKLVRPLFCRISKRDQLRADFAPVGQDPQDIALTAAGWPCSLLPGLRARLRALLAPQQSRKTLISLGNTATALQQHQLIADSPPVAGLKDWHNLGDVVKEIIPVVIVTSHVPNDPYHPALVAIKQARKLNDPVWVVGPSPNLKHLLALGVHIESRFEYNSTLEWLQTHLGIAKIEFARLWFLQAFMHRHNLTRVFSISADVMLYANITELTATLFPATRVALPVRWPSMQPPPLPSQFTSTSISAHAGLWHRDALDDFMQLYNVIVELALFGGQRGSPVGRKEYQEQIILGWYTWSQCWTRNLDPPCMAEPTVGISLKLGRWLARKTKYRPRFLVESLCQPRVCRNSSWSQEGLCVFDNSFSVASSTKFFRFRPPRDKCPQSKLYDFYHAWMGQTPRKNVQFLAVNFQGTRRDYLKLEDQDPSKTWGSAVF